MFCEQIFIFMIITLGEYCKVTHAIADTKCYRHYWLLSLYKCLLKQKYHILLGKNKRTFLMSNLEFFWFVVLIKDMIV